MLDQRIFGEEDGSLKLQSSAEKIAIDVTGTDEDTVALLSKEFDQFRAIFNCFLFII